MWLHGSSSSEVQLSQVRQRTPNKLQNRPLRNASAAVARKGKTNEAGEAGMARNLTIAPRRSRLALTACLNHVCRRTSSCGLSPRTMSFQRDHQRSQPTNFRRGHQRSLPSTCNSYDCRGSLYILVSTSPIAWNQHQRCGSPRELHIVSGRFRRVSS